MRKLLALACVVSTPAWAAWPDDVSLSGLEEHGGARELDTDLLGDAYRTVVRELGVAIASRTRFASGTIGASRFEVSWGTTFASLDGSNDDPAVPASWERVATDEEVGGAIYAPSLTLRKGLPASLELVVDTTWHGLTRQGAVGIGLRGSPVENFPAWPDLTFEAGYTGYVGNDELELGVFALAGSIGDRFSLVHRGAFRKLEIAPFGQISLLTITAAPVLDATTTTNAGVFPIGRRGRDVTSDPALFLMQANAGFELSSQHVVFRASGGVTTKANLHAGVSVGLRY